MGLDATKPVFGVTDKARLKPETSLLSYRDKLEKNKTLPVASLDMILFNQANNTGADQAARMRRLVCAWFLASRHICW